MVPYTFEFRAGLDDATTSGTGADAYPKCTFSAFQERLISGEAWQRTLKQSRFGQWSLGDESVTTAIWTNIDNAQFKPIRSFAVSMNRLGHNSRLIPETVELMLICASSMFILTAISQHQRRASTIRASLGGPRSMQMAGWT